MKSLLETLSEMLKLIDRQFLSLLRAGVWDVPVAEDLFVASTSWEDLFLLAKEQTVVPFVSDGVEKLVAQTGMDVPREVRKRFAAAVLKTEMRNARMDEFALKLVSRMEAAHIPVFVVKGQGVARYYPVPIRRQSGDIDLLVRRDDYERARDFLLPRASRVEEELDYLLHQGMFFGNYEVEVHGDLDPELSDRMHRSLIRFQEKLFAEGGRHLPIGEQSLPVPTREFDALYILLHLYHHFYHEGLAVRQILDWGMCLRAGGFDLTKLDAMIREAGVDYIWQLFGHFAVEMLGFREEDIPFYDKHFRSRSLLVWDFVRESGNFGKKIRLERGEQAYLVKKLHSFWLYLGVFARNFRMAPRDTMRITGSYLATAFRKLKKGV